MKTMHTKQHNARFKMLWLTALLSTAALVAACGGGGGGGTASVGSGGTGVFSGPISGFGSVIVNGVRLDDSSATVTLDDDNVGASGDLRLGMMVEIEGSRNADGVTGKANTIGSHSLVRGPVTATPAATTFRVLGLTVTVNAGTAFEGVTGIAGLVPGAMVEIHGIPSGPDEITATRIETTGNNEERLTGEIQAGSLTATTFKLHGTVINYASATNLPVLTEGLTVRVKGQLATAFATEPGTIDARQVQVRNKLKKNGQLLELEGVVNKFTSATDFEVNGTQVRVASNAKVEGSIALNSRVEVDGTVDANGVLVANKVELQNAGLEAEFEVHGTIADFNASARTFTLRSGTRIVSVRLIGTPTFVAPLTSAQLANNLKVEVKGNVVNGIVEVTRIKIED